MLSSGLTRSTSPVDLYPRLRLSTLSLPGTFQTNSLLKSNAAPEWTRHFHKHPAACTTLHTTNSSPFLSRPLSDPSQGRNTTRTPKIPHQVAIMQRPSTPYNDPKVQGPRAQQLASGNLSDLRKMMNQNTVNKTGLHPGGVQCVSFPLALSLNRTDSGTCENSGLTLRSSTDLTLQTTLNSVRTATYICLSSVAHETWRKRIQWANNGTEEELYESAHIDYNRVAIVCTKQAIRLKMSVHLAVAELTVFTDSQPISGYPLRRCSCLRARFRHHRQWCAQRLLWQEDRPLSSGQAYCQGAYVRKRHLVCGSPLFPDSIWSRERHPPLELRVGQIEHLANMEILGGDLSTSP